MGNFRTPRRATGGKLRIGSSEQRTPRVPRELLRCDAGANPDDGSTSLALFPDLAAFCVQIPTGRLYQYNSQT